MTGYSRPKLYRNTRDARIMGVCAGLADYLDVRVCVVRFLTIVGCIMSGGWLIALYFVVGFILDPKPDHLYDDDDEREFRREEAAEARRRPSRRERRRERRDSRRERWQARRDRRAERSDRKYWQKANPSTPDYDTGDIRRRFDEVEKRTQKLEAYMTSKKFRLDRELRGLED